METCWNHELAMVDTLDRFSCRVLSLASLSLPLSDCLPGHAGGVNDISSVVLLVRPWSGRRCCFRSVAGAWVWCVWSPPPPPPPARVNAPVGRCLVHGAVIRRRYYVIPPKPPLLGNIPSQWTRGYHGRRFCVQHWGTSR